MATLTRKAVIHDATSDPNEVLVVFEDERGIARNVLLRDAATLKTELEAERTAEQPVSSTPTEQKPETPVDAPVFSTAEDAAFSAAEIVITPPVVVDAVAADAVAPVAEPRIAAPAQ